MLLNSTVNIETLNRSRPDVRQNCSDRGTVGCGDGGLVNSAVRGAGGSQAGEESGGEERREVNHYE